MDEMKTGQKYQRNITCASLVSARKAGYHERYHHAGGKNMAFQVWEHLPGVFHIKDAMGVCMTLLTGADSALLFDTGYGLEDVHGFVRSLTSLPLQVVLSHAHHDHALGSRYFDAVFLLEKEQETFQEYTKESWRRHVLREAKNAGVIVDEEEYLTAATAPVKILREGDLQLGDLTVRVIACPGHTPGSAVIYVPERELLLTGDNWNPCTWLFFPEACGAQEYRRNVFRLLDLPFRYVLCPHGGRLIRREEFEAFLRQLTDEALEQAPDDPVGTEMGIRTAEASLPGGGRFVFDREKLWGKYSDTWLRSLPTPVPDGVRTPPETARFELDAFLQTHPEEPAVVLSLEESLGDGYEIIPPDEGCMESMLPAGEGAGSKNPAAASGKSSSIIRGGRTGILYGTYAYLLSGICKEPLPKGLQTPACPLRMLKMKLATTQASANAAKATADAMRTLGQTTPVTIRCAITVIATVPILLVYPFLQQYFVTGIALGSVKE